MWKGSETRTDLVFLFFLGFLIRQTFSGLSALVLSVLPFSRQSFTVMLYLLRQICCSHPLLASRSPKELLIILCFKFGAGLVGILPPPSYTSTSLRSVSTRSTSSLAAAAVFAPAITFLRPTRGSGFKYFSYSRIRNERGRGEVTQRVSA